MATSTHTSALELSFVTDCPTVRPPANDVICYNTVKYGTKKIRFWALLGPARHEQELVVHRVSHTEGDVGAARPAKSLDGVGYGAEVLQRLGEGPEVEGGELGHERFLVLEMVVDGRRRVADLRGDGAHGRGFVSALHEHASRRVENLLARLDALALPALEAGNGLGHNLVISYNDVTFVSRDETRSHDDLGDDDNPECARRTRCGVLPDRGAPVRPRGTGPPRLGAGRSHPLCRRKGHEASLHRQWPGTCPGPAAHTENPARHVPESHPRPREALSDLRHGLPRARLLRHSGGDLFVRVLRHARSAVSGPTRHSRCRNRGRVHRW